MTHLIIIEMLLIFMIIYQNENSQIFDEKCDYCYVNLLQSIF